MSLPLQWVDRIFDKLTLAYGAAFLNRWRDVDINAVKSDWMHELSGFEHAPHAIAFALANLPENPPTVMQFRSLARSAPQKDVPQLEAPKADPQRVKAELAKLKFIASEPIQKVDRLDWARRILANPVGKTPTVLFMARTALENKE